MYLLQYASKLQIYNSTTYDGLKNVDYTVSINFQLGAN